MGKRVIMITQHLWISVFGREGSHPPHCHIVFKGEKKGAIDLNTFETRDIEVDRSVEKKAVELARKAQPELLREWMVQNGK